MPRQYEHHGHKRIDFIAALSMLERRPDFRAGLLGAVGICLGAGYVADLSMVDNRLRALGLVAGYYRDVESMRQSDPSGFDARMKQGVEARKHYEISGQLDLVPAVALDGDAAMKTPDTFDYYSRRAAVPNYRNEFAVMSREFFLPFDVQACAARLQAPFAMVHSERALSPGWARKFYQSTTVSKEELWLGSQGQTDFYDNAQLVRQSVEWLAPRLKQILGVEAGE